MAELSDQQIREIVHQWVKKALEQYEEIRLRRSQPWSAEELTAYLNSLDDDIKVYKEKLLQGHYDLVEPGALEFLAEKGLHDIPKNSLEFRKLCSALLKGMIAVFMQEKRNASGEGLDDELDSLLDNCIDNIPSTPATRQNPTGPQITLSEALESYREEKIRHRDWTGRTETDMRPRLDLFNEAVDDISIKMLSKDDIRKFKHAVEHLPARRSVMPRYKGKSLNELLAMKVPENDRMSNSTIGQYFGAVVSFLLWLKANYDGINDGLTDVLKPPSVQPSDEQRSVFTEDDLQKIFQAPGYKPDNFKQAYKFWVPLIGLYSGMRLEEICQLTIDDIKQIDEVWCFDVNDQVDKRVKTIASKRYIPIHPKLIDELGLLDYVKAIKKKGSDRLFPELKKQSGRYSHYVSRWFNGTHLPKTGIGKAGRKKVFHSFRHTFAHTCKLAGIPEDKVSQLMGHETSGNNITYGRYGKKYPPGILLRDVVSKVDFDIDLEQLKKSKHVRGKNLANNRPLKKRK
ncbi:integrase [Desulfoferula mesophila]|uniref:Integrase n=2 Tax=Desulfoferula mesophila TaxID=3058419 RepID=A0AAU9EMG9_9BACT|nr:integrase [Desulfoferula mesophilus]